MHVSLIHISTLYCTTHHPTRSPTIVNVWSHLIGAIACIVVAPLAYFKIFHILETVHWTDVVHFYIFMAGAILCLSMSALFHLFSCHSEPVSHQWNRCDYVGIVFLITGSFYPAIFYGNILLPFLAPVLYPAMKGVSITLNLSHPWNTIGFYCFRTFQIMYIAMISIFGGATIIAVTKPIFRTPQYRWIRSCLFLAMGLSAVFPVIHGLFLYGVRLLPFPFISHTPFFHKSTQIRHSVTRVNPLSLLFFWTK